MTISAKHAKTSAAADTADAGLIQPSDWNAEHEVQLAGPALVGRAAAGTGAAQEITLGANLTLSAGGVLAATGNVNTSVASATAIPDLAAFKLLGVDASGNPVQIAVSAFFAQTGQAVSSLSSLGALQSTDVLLVTRAGQEYQATVSALPSGGGTVSTPPGAPTGLALGTATSSSQPLSWTAPSSAGTSAITDYTVQYALAGSGSWQTFAHTASTTASITVTGLTAGTSYDYRVAAVSSAGSSSYSSTATGSTAAAVGTPPGAPTALTLGTATSTTQPLSWTAGTAGSTATTDYIVQYRVTGAGSWSTFSDGTSTATSATVTGLTPGVSHDYQVAAVNGAGTGSYSSTATGSTAAAVPGQVTGLTLGTATSTTQPISWTAPAANGSAITDYVIQYRITGSGSWTTFADGTSTATSTTVTGLTASTSYDYQVSAVNAVGAGANSTTVTGSTAAAAATVPGAPTIGTATSGDTTASATFTAPASNGGSAITGYTVTASPGGATATGAASPITVTGLTNGTAYTFTVHATNAVGNSAESAASNAVTPAASLLTAQFRVAPTGTTAAYGGATYAGMTSNDVIVAYNGAAKEAGVVRFMYGTSPTTPPVKNSTGLAVTYTTTDPVNNNNDNKAGTRTGGATYPGNWRPASTIYVWGGPAGPDTYYLWAFTDDNGGSACVVKDTSGAAAQAFTVNA